MTPIEFLNGEPLSPEDLESLRVMIETADIVEEVHDDVRGIVKRNWPHLLAKLPSEDE
jgi:hypothetical protein